VVVKPKLALVFLNMPYGSIDRIDANFIPTVCDIPSLMPTQNPTGIQYKLYEAVVKYNVNPRPRISAAELMPTTTDSPTDLLI